MVVIHSGCQLGPDFKHETIERVSRASVHNQSDGRLLFMLERKEFGEIVVCELVEQDSRKDYRKIVSKY